MDRAATSALTVQGPYLLHHDAAGGRAGIHGVVRQSIN